MYTFSKSSNVSLEKHYQCFFSFLYINDLLRHLDFKIKLISKWLHFILNYVNIFIALLEGNLRTRKTWPISKTIQTFSGPLRYITSKTGLLIINGPPYSLNWSVTNFFDHTLKYDTNVVCDGSQHNFTGWNSLWPVPWKRLRTPGVLWHGKRLFRSLSNWKSHFVSRNSGHDPAMILNNWEMNEIQRLNFILENFVFEKISLHFMISELNKYS